MELQQLRYFLAVSESHSFSRAAERCLVAQPSLSQQIKKLEREIGYKLFDRLPTGSVLTDAGRALLPKARNILAEVNSILGIDLHECELPSSRVHTSATGLRFRNGVLDHAAWRSSTTGKCRLPST